LETEITFCLTVSQPRLSTTAIAFPLGSHEIPVMIDLCLNLLN